MPNYLGTKYYVIFLDDYDKTLEGVLLSSKDRVLSAFDLFWKCNKYEKARIWHHCIDGGGKDDSHTFEDYHEKYDII